MTCTDTNDTGRERGEESGHPSVSGPMAGMMEGCGCGPMMAKMKALCTGTGSTDDVAKEDGAVQQPTEPGGAGQQARTG